MELEEEGMPSLWKDKEKTLKILLSLQNIHPNFKKIKDMAYDVEFVKDWERILQSTTPEEEELPGELQKGLEMF